MTRAAILLIGFAMAAAGMINAAPAFWIIPRIGPLPLEITRAAIMGGAIVIAMLTTGFAARRRADPRLRWLSIAADALLVIAAGYVLTEYVRELQSLKTQGLFLFEPRHAVVAAIACAVFIIVIYRMWGAPLAITALVALFYYFTCQYWPSIFEAAPPDIVDDFPSDIWFNIDKGIMGDIVGIVIGTVFPFIILGALLHETGAGLSMIRLAYNATRRTRGGPAHAAVVSSALFGMMSGAAVANVVGTGTITIPMIKRRGFSPEFAGGVEAAASSGGQITPPVMGTAALVMADFLQIPYLTICIAALLPAFFYYFSLVLGIIVEARRLNVEVSDRIEDSMRLEPQDWLNLLMVGTPIAVIVVCLVAGFSPAGSGVLAVLSMLPLSLVSPVVRRNPASLLAGFARGGRQFAGLMIAVSSVGIVVAVLSTTGLPNDFAFSISGVTDGSLFLTLCIVMLGALCLGMGLPTLPAYLTIVIVLGPALTKLGLPLLVAHLFVFYYGICAHITPPVAVASFAAATIAEAPPMRTSIMTLRIGLAKFLIPFVFVYYPVLLLVDEAGGFALLPFLSVMLRFVLALWLFSTAFSFYDRSALTPVAAGLRLAIAVALLVVWPAVHWAAFAAAVVVLVLHYREAGFRLKPEPSAG